MLRDSSRLSGSEGREARGGAYDATTMIRSSRAQFRDNNGRRTSSRTVPTVGQRRGSFAYNSLGSPYISLCNLPRRRMFGFWKDRRMKCWLVQENRLVMS